MYRRIFHIQCLLRFRHPRHRHRPLLLRVHLFHYLLLALLHLIISFLLPRQVFSFFPLFFPLVLWLAAPSLLLQFGCPVRSACKTHAQKHPAVCLLKVFISYPCPRWLRRGERILVPAPSRRFPRRFGSPQFHLTYFG